MRQRLSDPSAPFTVDLKLLLECMQLFNQGDDASIAADRQLYRSCKALYAHAEAQSILSVHLLQSCLLLAAYEVAHAIYPTAYLSVGTCARLGICMGLHDGKSALQLLPLPGMSAERPSCVLLLATRFFSDVDRARGKAPGLVGRHRTGDVCQPGEQTSPTRVSSSPSR